MSIRVLGTRLSVLPMRTRMPFKYGIATLTSLPHLFVESDVEIDGVRQRGLASDGLPPKWFTKNPDTAFVDDLRDMIAVIRSARDIAVRCGTAPTCFELWLQICSEQERWAAPQKFPALLYNFGVSLIERSILDALCRAKQCSLAAAVRANLPGIRLREVCAELDGAEPADLLPRDPLRRVYVRHTIGLADPLTAADIPPNERADDGLPQSLEESIAAYALTHFKIKLCGNAQKDFARLSQLAAIIEASCSTFGYTLDGNEQYHTVDEFRTFWDALHAQNSLQHFLKRLIFVEQPFHRDVALLKSTGDALLAWKSRPPIIIDESDGSLSDLPTALEMGYAGTSHKNCKGIIKGLRNACLLQHRRRSDATRAYILSGEDLANVGPVALLQDLAVAATLGVEHVERNGHHYFAGLSMYSPGVQAQVLAAHGDLYRKHERGFAALRITNGHIELGSVVDAPFGSAITLDTSAFTPLGKFDLDTVA
ncbi:MAG TPA: hypothetical protein VEK08_01645 [Planctomycetota bacterium]|nr:hypothetical protein [Planctomycetota bacterium]